MQTSNKFSSCVRHWQSRFYTSYIESIDVRSTINLAMINLGMINLGMINLGMIQSSKVNIFFGLFQYLLNKQFTDCIVTVVHTDFPIEYMYDTIKTPESGDVIFNVFHSPSMYNRIKNFLRSIRLVQSLVLFEKKSLFKHHLVSHKSIN